MTPVPTPRTPAAGSRRRSTADLRRLAGRITRTALGTEGDGAAGPTTGPGAAGPTGPARPELSVIIPVRDVEAYVEECLRSVLSQSVPSMEVIVVDDGSADSTAEIVGRLAAADDRIRVLHQANTGNGAARNRAVEIATGTYLTFADGDDIVPDGAYSAMLETLKQTGSDFVCGSFDRLEAGRRTRPAIAARANGTTVLRTDAVASPQIMHNPFFWNKMFVRSFWDTAVGPIPEGVNYEDQAPTLAAMLRATSFDILDRTVYVWRRREDGTSLTQRKRELADLRARLTVIDSLLALVQHASEQFRTLWFAKVVADDLKYFIAQTPVVEDAYLHEMAQGIRALDRLVPVDSWQHVPFLDRALWHYAGRGERRSVETILHESALNGVHQPIAGTRFAPTFADAVESPLPELLTAVAPVDVVSEGRLRSLTWSAPHLLDVGLVTLVRGVAPGDLRDVRLVATSSTTGELVELDAAPAPDPTVDTELSSPWHSYAGAAHVARVDVTTLREAAHGGHWSFHVTAVAAFGPVTIPVRTLGTGCAFPASPVLDGGRAVFRWDRANGLTLLHQTASVTATASIAGRRVTIDVTSAKGHAFTELVLTARGLPDRVVPAARTAPGRASFVFHHPHPGTSVPLTRTLTWDLQVRTRTGGTARLAAPGSAAEARRASARHEDLRVGASGWGLLQLDERRWRCGLDTVTLSDDGVTLTLAGSARAIEPRTPEIILAGPAGTLSATRVRRFTAENRWEATFRLRDDDGRAVASGRYLLRWRASWHASVDEAYYVEDLRALPTGGTTTEERTPLHRVVGSSTPTGSFALRLAAPFRSEERSRFAQRAAQAAAFTGADKPLRPGVLFESFNGKSFGDNVAPIARELATRDLGIPIYVSVVDHTVAVPDFAIPVLAHSREWYDIASSAQVVVTNNNLPQYFRKQRGQLCYQAWHGTPLKRLLRDMPAASRRLDYWRHMDRERHEWDVLLAQNAASVAPFRSAFGFEGRIDVAGYPRNDALVVGAERRQAVRAALGLREDERALLYMPTWRDDARGTDGRVRPVSFLDPARFVGAVGERWVVLTRAHHVAGDRLASDGADVIDVSTHPDVTDLYLAADVLATDYSSAMFDYTNTGKPIVFLAPDLDEYAERTRGFYFDLAAEAPGPILGSTDELVDYAPWIEEDAAVYAGRYSAWTHKYNRWDDGRAAVRVTDSIVGRLG